MLCACMSPCQSTYSIIVLFLYQALRNLASLRDEAWATEVGAVFLGPLLAVMRLIDDDAAVQQAVGVCTQQHAV